MPRTATQGRDEATGARAGAPMRRGRIAVAVLLTLAGTALLLVPLDHLPDPEASVFGGMSIELLAHVALSLGAVGLWGWALAGTSVATLAGVGIGLAAGTELLQALPFVLRSAEAQDFAYNLVGVALGLAGVVLFRRVRAWSRGRWVRGRRS